MWIFDVPAARASPAVTRKVAGTGVATAAPSTVTDATVKPAGIVGVSVTTGEVPAADVVLVTVTV